MSTGKKIFRGAFNYFRGNYLFGEESFEVFKDEKDMSLTFVSELLSRAQTGELLKINCTYTMNKDFNPSHVLIQRTLGTKTATEEFTIKSNNMKYFLRSGDDVVERDLTTPPKFFIAAPVTGGSLMFIPQKKMDASNKTFYTIFVSHNTWEFSKEIESTSIVIEKVGLTSEKITIDGQEVDATRYRFYDQEEMSQLMKTKKEAATPNYLLLFMSKHLAIPYVVENKDGTKIKVKYLNDLGDKN